MVLVGEEEGLWETGRAAVWVCTRHVKTRPETRFQRHERVLQSFCAFILGRTLGKLEYVGQEEGVVGLGCLVEELGTLGMELERILEELQSFVDLDPVSLTFRTKYSGRITWSSLVVSNSSSMFSSGSRLMAEKGGCEMQVSAAREDARWQQCLP